MIPPRDLSWDGVTSGPGQLNHFFRDWVKHNGSVWKLKAVQENLENWEEPLTKVVEDGSPRVVWDAESSVKTFLINSGPAGRYLLFFPSHLVQSWSLHACVSNSTQLSQGRVVLYFCLPVHLPTWFLTWRNLTNICRMNELHLLVSKANPHLYIIRKNPLS